VPPRKFDFEPHRGPRPPEGYIGLQNHSDNDVVFFKEVAIRSLKYERPRRTWPGGTNQERAHEDWLFSP
jgi:hypothetical protein